MNRLWVRLSLNYAGVYLLVVFAILILPSLVGLYLHVTAKGAEPMSSAMMAEGSPEMAAMEAMPGWVSAELWQIWIEVLRASFIGGVIGIGAGIWTSRSVSKPVAQLAEAAEAVSRRDFSHRVTDVTWGRELVALADTFNHMAVELEEAETLRRQLITDVAHELRTPLTVLAGNLNAALDRVYDLTEEEFAQLYSQTHHLIRLVNDLHDLAQAEARQLPLTRKQIDLKPLIRETCNHFAVLADEESIDLRCELPTEPVMAYVDDVRIRQVLHNLLSNSLSHTPRAGTITLLARLLPEHIQISISDTGAGIDPTHLPYIFDRLYRGDRSRSRHTGGAGLGLTIVKALVETHGGQVSATSAGLNQGSTFSLTLPKR